MESTRLVFVQALVVALLIDLTWGEPPARIHPVVWMGHYLHRAGRWLAPTRTPPDDAPDWRRFWLGASLWLAGAIAVIAIAALLQHGCLGLNAAVGVVLIGAILKPLFAWRMLRLEVLAVEAALGQSVEQGRARLARLVSREVAQLTETEIRESGIESLAENLNDSLVAPLFWFALLGLPGAALYRFANTADAMWGYRGVYRGHDWTWAGKWAARADDVLSWAPARITAWLLIALAPRGARRRAALGLPTEAGRTASPNSGWSMAAMALLLNVRLAKPGVYVLHAEGQPPSPADTRRAVSLANRAVAAWAACTVGAMVLVGLPSGVWR